MKPVFKNFTVAGHGAFPVDMLRYDACWPADGQSAANIVLNTSEMRARDSQREVRLLTALTRDITDLRWASFGWVVVPEVPEMTDADAFEILGEDAKACGYRGLCPAYLKTQRNRRSPVLDQARAIVMARMQEFFAPISNHPECTK